MNRDIQWCLELERQLEEDEGRHAVRMAEYIIRKEQENV